MPKFLLERPEITEKDLEGKTAEEQEMMKLMGFGTFDSSKVFSNNFIKQSLIFYLFYYGN